MVYAILLRSWLCVHCVVFGVLSIELKESKLQGHDPQLRV